MFVTNTMNSAIFIVCTVFFAQTYTAPVIQRRPVTEVCAIITDSCTISSGSLATPSLGLSAAIAASRLMGSDLKQKLQSLKGHLNDILDRSNKIQENYKLVWLMYYDDMVPAVKGIMRISPVRHCDISLEQNIKFHILMQLGIFTNYIRSQDWDEAYTGVRADLTQMKATLNKALCLLKSLVQPASTISHLEAYVDRDYIKPMPALVDESEIVKRAFVMAELIVLSETLSTYVINETDITLKDETLSTVQC
ncbi:hypothetical protein BgiBS90_009737 [Biomphalaria glabrata]|nr:hypothetical protein BgiBS90_009737 [Biomphalaria glabrata]